MTLDVTPDFLPWGAKPQGMSWNRWSRRQCCARKVRHESWEAARVAGLLVWQENPQGINPPTPYPCSVLGEPHYHCGHMKLPERRKPRRGVEPKVL